MLLAGNMVVGDACPEQVTLSDSSSIVAGSEDSTEVIIQLSDIDLNKLKKSEGLVVSKETSFLSITANAVDDMNGEQLDAVEHKQAFKFFADGKKCTLNSYTLNMQTGIMSLTFDETVDHTEFEGTRLTLHKLGNLGNSAVEGTGSLTLKAGSSSQTDSTIITFTLDEDDLHALKLDTTIATAVDGSNTYLEAGADAVADQNGQALNAITADDAKRASSLVPDEKKPELDSFEFNVNTATMILTFTEPVKASTFTLNRVGLANAVSGATAVVQLKTNKATVSTTNGLTITISDIDAAEMNDIKAATGLATAQANTVILLSNDAVRDMNDQSIASIAKAAKADPTPDTEHPTLTGFHFSLDEGGSVQLTFSESINVGTLTSEAITLQGAETSDGVKEYTLSTDAAKDANDVNGPIINVRFSLDDGDAIKRLEFCTAKENCFVRITSDAISDMVGKAVTAIGDGAAFPSGSVAGDSTSPTIESVTEVTKEGKITIVFSEPIPPLNLVYTGLTMYGADPDDFDPIDETTLALSGGSTQSTIGRTLVIQMVDDDVDKFKEKSGLCGNTNGQNCYLKFTSAFTKDLFNNQLTAILVRKPGAVVLDGTPPAIDTYTLDLKTNFLKITFDEPVKVSTFTPSTVKLQSSETDNTASSYTLAQNDQGLKNEADSREVNVPLQVADQVAIKALQDLGTSITNTFVSMALGTVVDLSDNKNVVVADTAADQADAHDADNTDPVFMLFALANPNSGTLRLLFNEPVDKATLDCSKLTLQQDNAGSGSPIVLTTPNALSITYPDETTKMEVDIEITTADRETAQLDADLFTERADTFIVVATGAIKDMAGRSVQGAAFPAKVDTFLERDAASLADYTLDMNLGTIILTFSAVVKVESFEASKMRVQATQVLSSAGTHHVTLSDSAMTGSSGLQVTVKLSVTDLNKIKADRGLATETDRSDSWLAMDADCFLDNFDDAVTAIADTSAKKASSYVPDITPPEITSFDLSLDPGFLLLTYSEEVDIDTFEADGLYIQSLESDNTVKVRLFGGSILETDTATIIKYTLSTDNLDDLKFKDMATGRTDTWLAAATGHIDDMASVDLKVIASSSALKANDVSVDSTPPTLKEFVLDMQAETLTMTFSEAVLVASLTQNKITIRDGAPGTSSVQLSGDSTANTQVSSTVLKIDLSLADLNALKADGSVARNTGSTFLSCGDGAVADASSLGIEEIVAGSAKPADDFEADDTDPALSEFEFDVDAKTITLKFSETVNVNPFNVDAVLVQKTSKASENIFGDQGGKYQLTTSSTVQTATKNSDTVVINLSDGDLNAIKLDLGLVISEVSTWISFPATAVSDVFGNPVTLVDPESAARVAAGKLNADATGPVLTSFTINLQNEKLVLVFDEPVDADELKGNKLTLSASAASNVVPNPVKHSLDGGLPEGSADGLTVTLSLVDADLNAIKKLFSLATGEGNTWISADAGFATDVALQTSLELPLSSAKKSSFHTPDETAPTADALSMNLIEGTFKLEFTETIDISSIVYEKFTFQIASSVSNAADMHALTGGTLVSTEDGTEVEVKISDADMNVLKQKSIANLQTRAHLIIGEGGIFDMNSRPLNAIVNGQALNANPHVKDNADPSIDKVVSLSMHTGLLTLSFDETVRTTTLLTEKLYIQNRANSVKYCPPKSCLNNEYIASAASTPNQEQTAEFTIDTDCQVCTECDVGDFESTPCTSTVNSVCTSCGECPEGQYMTAFCSGDDQTSCSQCGGNCKACYGPDNYCTECDADYSLITAGDFAGECFRNDGSEFDSGFNPNVYAEDGYWKACHPINSQCTGPDKTDIKDDVSCAPSYVFLSGTCSPACGAGSQFSLNGAACAPCHSSCATCSGDGADDCTACTGNDFMLFRISNSDTTDDAFGDRECIPKNNAGETCPDGFRDDTVVRDSVTYNTCTSCGSHCDTCSATTGCTKCVSGSYLQLIATTGISVCADATDASETARLNAGADPQIRYLADGSGTKSSGNGAERDDQTCTLKSDTDVSYLLTTHVLDATSFTNSANGAEIVIDLSTDDQNKLKADVGIATETSNTFIAFDAELIDDMASNDVTAKSPIPVCPDPCIGTCTCPINSQVTLQVIQDGIPPSLISFDLDMDGDGKLTLVFSETVLQSSFKPEEVQIQIGDGDQSSKTTIEGSSLTWPQLTTVEIVPTVDELNGLKAKRTLAIDEASTWLSFTADTVKDMNNNPVTAIAFNAAKQVRVGGYTPDTTEPELVSFDFSANSKELKLTFSETIDAGTITPGAILFQDGATASASAAVSLSGEESKSTLDSTEVTITLSDDDMNAIKAKYGTPMATDDSDTYLRLASGFVKDTAKVANTVQALTVGNGMKVRTGGYSADIQDPEIDTYNLNMHTNELSIVFTETVNLANFDETKLTFVANGATPYVLTDSATWSTSPPAKEVVVTLSTVDMNALKRNLQLCISDSTTNLVITTEAISDMAGNSIVKIDAPGKNVEVWTTDTNKPVLTAFTMNMMSKQIVLTFSETVDVANLDETKILLQQKVTASQGTQYRLTADSVATGQDNVNSHIAIISLGEFDTNSIKAVENLAIANEEIYITMDADAVRDMFNQPSKVISDGLGIKITDNSLVPDTEDPTLTGFDLNMDTATAKLSLTFSETVRAGTLQAGAFTLINSDASTEYTLTLPSPDSSSALNVLNFDLSTSDMNQIKARTDLATKNDANSAAGGDSDTFIIINDYGNGNDQAIKDMDGNNLEPILAGNKVQVTNYVADDTDPELVSFSAQMVSGAPPILLKLVFSEPVKVTSVMDVSGFVLQPDQGGADASAAVPLSSATSSRDADLVTVDITISATDLATIRGKENVGRSSSVTYASILSKFTTDEAGNSIKVIGTGTALQVDASPFTVDIVPPTLNAFELDLSTQSLTLSFSEPVELDTLTLGTFYLQATETSNADKVIISTGSKSLANSGQDIVISLEQSKVDEIKANSNLAVNQDSTWIVIDTGAVEDTAENENIAIATGAAKKAFKYTFDNVAPTLTSYTFDLKSGVFVMTFSEVMDIENFNLAEMIIQNSGANPTLETVALAGDVLDKSNAVDATIVSLELTEDSANTARAIANLATSASDTFVRFTSSFATDVDNVGITAKDGSVAKGCAANGYTQDDEPPTATSFEIDFTSDDFSNMITIHFTQPVDSATVDPETITMQYDASTTESRTLTGGTASGGLTTAVKINLIEADVNEIKRLPLCAAGNNGGNCLLHFGASFGADSESNAVVALNVGTTVALKQGGYAADTTRPSIITKGFTKLDLNTGHMTITFSETVDRTEFDATQITLTNSFIPSLAMNNPLNLEQTTMISTEDGVSLEVKLTNDDLNKLKSESLLCTTPNNCYLTATAGTADDMAGRPSLATDSDDMTWAPYSFVQTLTTDGTGPILNSFDLNMNTNKLTLHFDETVNHDKFDPKVITLQGGGDQSFKFYTLTGGDPVYPAAGEYASSLTVTLTSGDIVEIKLKEICESGTGTYLSATSGMIADTNSKPSANAFQTVAQGAAKLTDASTYVGDQTKPQLLAYTLDLDSGELIFSFNEPVDTTATDPRKFTLQSDNTANPGFTRTLAAALISESPKTATNTITITLAEGDISAIKLDNTVGTSIENTYLSFEDDATADTKGNGILGLSGASAKKATAHIEDSSFAELQSFDMDLEARTLTLTFDEIMDPTSLVPSAITLRAARDSGEPKYPLSNSASSSTAGQVVVIDLSNEDFLGLSLKAGLATGRSDTFLTLTVSAIKDAFTRDVLGVPIARAHQATDFQADSGAPEIDDSVFDVAKGELGLTFTEAVNKDVFKVDSISFQHVRNLDALQPNAPAAIQLTTPTLITWAGDYRSVVIKLNDVNLDAIKVRKDLGTATSNTFLVFGTDLVTDFAPVPNSIAAATSDIGEQIKRHEADNIKPKLDSFGVNMDTGVLSLHFDETMNAESVKMEKYTFQYREDLTATDSSGP